MKIVIATHNPHKLEEIRALFDLPGLDVLSAFDFPDVPETVEDGDTLEANAMKKAVEVAVATQSWALADDTGLEVDALNGEPGVYSARYAGEDATYESNCTLLLSNLEKMENRRARFRSVVALSSPGGEVRTVDGCCDGVITTEGRGGRGFGYDPIFQPDGHTQTFAEMDAATKNAISHRGRALVAAREAWGVFLGKQPAGW